MNDKHAAVAPLERLWGWLAGTSIAARKPRHRAGHTRIPTNQLAALSAALDAEHARPRLPNLLVVEQTLHMAPAPELAAVPDFVLARSLVELRSLAAFKRSAALQAFDEVVQGQVLRNEQTLWHGNDRVKAVPEEEEDFQDTQPMEECRRSNRGFDAN